MKEKYQERSSLINKAIRCEPVDRIPLIWHGMTAAPKLMGLTMSDYIYNPIKGINSQLEYMDRIGVDGSNNGLWFRPDVVLTSLFLNHVKMPGKEMPENMIWQVKEAQLMTVEDYDTILDKGFEAFLESILPEIIDMKEFRQGTKQMEKFSPVMQEKMFQHGYPSVCWGGTTIPFETLCGGRSMPSFFMDLFRMPDKVVAVMDSMVPFYINMALETVKMTGIRCVSVITGRSASAMLDPGFWDRFVMPYLQKIVDALAEHDIISVLHMDHDWTRDLGRFLDLPHKKCVFNPDGMTDIRKIKKILGDHMAILGDVPATLLAFGTPESVRKYVKELIQDIGTTGLLLCPGCEAPINTKHENVVAMYEAGREFGTT